MSPEYWIYFFLIGWGGTWWGVCGSQKLTMGLSPLLSTYVEGRVPHWTQLALGSPFFSNVLGLQVKCRTHTAFFCGSWEFKYWPSALTQALFPWSRPPAPVLDRQKAGEIPGEVPTFQAPVAKPLSPDHADTPFSTVLRELQKVELDVIQKCSIQSLVTFGSR